MNNVWTKKWKSVFVWISAYLSYVAYALVGGYVIVKGEDEELQKTAKKALLVTLIFAAVSAFLSLFNYIGGFADRYYGSGAYEFYSVCLSLVGIAKIIVYTVFIVLEFIKKDENTN